MEELEDFCFEQSEDEGNLLVTQRLGSKEHAWAFLQPASYSRNRLQAAKPYVYKYALTSPFSALRPEPPAEETRPVKSQSVAYEARLVPVHPASRSAEGKEHFQALQSMFERRPIWLKTALAQQLSVRPTKNNLKQ